MRRGGSPIWRRSWAMPAERALYESLAQGRTLVRYDKAGCGLSGATAQAPWMKVELETLDAVVRAVQRRRSTCSVRGAVRGGRRPGPRSIRLGSRGWCCPGDRPARRRHRDAAGARAHPRTDHGALGPSARTCSPTSSPPTPMLGPGPPSSATSARPQREPSRARCSPSPTTSTSPTCIAKVQVPTLVLRRDHDRAAPLEQGQALVPACRALAARC